MDIISSTLLMYVSQQFCYLSFDVTHYILDYVNLMRHQHNPHITHDLCTALFYHSYCQ